MKAINITLGIIVAIGAAFVALVIATDPGRNLVIEDATVVTAVTGDRTATGVVRNVTDRPFTQLQIVADFLTYGGDVVGRATTTLGTIEPLGTLKFEFPVTWEDATSIRAKAVSPDNVRWAK